MSALDMSKTEQRLPPRSAGAKGLASYVERGGDEECSISLLVDGAHCGACVRRIEGVLGERPMVTRARLNLSTRRLELAWRGVPDMANAFVADIDGLGYAAVPYLPDEAVEMDMATEKHLLTALAVALFATSNVMMLSWAVWMGHSGGMEPGMRSFFHWLSALVALPAIMYSGRHFFRSALAVVRRGRTNMDVPISLGVLLTAGMSLYETMAGGRHVYFDGALSLLTVLLIGRYLDQRVRRKARSAVQRLATMTAQPVQVIHADGSLENMPANSVQVGARVLVAPGERFGVDGIILDGQTSIETGLLDGETTPKSVDVGDTVYAGTTNLGSAVSIGAIATGRDTVLAEIIRLLEAAEQKKGRFVALADKAVQLYTPVIHGLALTTFLGWLLFAQQGWQIAMVNAVCVLIIACPCALGLAVPVTQVIAASRLMKSGILLKSETALERLAEIDTVVLDKTGTLTKGRMEAVADGAGEEDLVLASAIAAASTHPAAKAVRALVPGAQVLTGVVEEPGRGLSWQGADGEFRLGSAGWCGLDANDREISSTVWLVGPSRRPIRFILTDAIRPDARVAIDLLKRKGYQVSILSGDRGPAVAAVAEELGIDDWQAGVSPQQKIAAIERLRAAGRSVLMVGDGLNDAPALAAANASLAPARAAEISRQAADAIWQGDQLMPLIELLDTAKKARAIVVQNIGFSFIYNAAWVPVAMAGLVTPWVAALAMSASSLLVTLNAMRLNLSRRRAH